MRFSAPFRLLPLFVAFPLMASPEAADRFSSEAQEAYKMGNYQKAVDLLTQAIAEDPGNPELYENRGSSYDNLGKVDEALRDFDASYKKMVERSKDPKDKGLAEVLYNRGAVLARARRFPEALVDFEKAVEIDSDFPDVRMDMAWILATAPEAEFRKPQKALEYVQEEIRRNGSHSPGVLDTLAAALAATGKFEEAVLQEKTALEQASNILQRKQYRDRLHLYQEKKPYLDTADAGQK